MALFLWRERRSVLTSSIAGLTEKVSCNFCKSNERCSKNNTIIRIELTLFNKEYLSEIDYKSTEMVK